MVLEFLGEAVVMQQGKGVSLFGWEPLDSRHFQFLFSRLLIFDTVWNILELLGAQIQVMDLEIVLAEKRLESV